MTNYGSNHINREMKRQKVKGQKLAAQIEAEKKRGLVSTQSAEQKPAQQVYSQRTTSLNN